MESLQYLIQQLERQNVAVGLEPLGELVPEGDEPCLKCRILKEVRGCIGTLRIVAVCFVQHQNDVQIVLLTPAQTAGDSGIAGLPFDRALCLDQLVMNVA